MDAQFSDLSVPDPTIRYYCSPFERSSGFTQLMKYVLMVKEYPEVIPLIENIIKNTDKVNIQNNKGWTPLMIACRNSNTDSDILVVKMLIDGGAHVNIRNKDKWTALMFASKNSDSDSNLGTVKMLIDAGAHLDIKNKSGFTPLMAAIVYSNIETTKMLIDAGANVNILSNFNYNALMLVCSQIDINNVHSIETVKLLVNAGSHINIKDIYSDTSLKLSIKNIEIVKILINAGADVNIKYKNDKTFLMLLITEENLEDNVDLIIQLLHTSRETLLDIDDYGKSAYDYYVEKGHNILDEYQLKILKGDIHLNMTKSARLG